MGELFFRPKTRKSAREGEFLKTSIFLFPLTQIITVSYEEYTDWHEVCDIV